MIGKSGEIETSRWAVLTLCIRLAEAEKGGNWLYPFDQISPLEI